MRAYELELAIEERKGNLLKIASGLGRERIMDKSISLAMKDNEETDKTILETL